MYNLLQNLFFYIWNKRHSDNFMGFINYYLKGELEIMWYK